MYTPCLPSYLISARAGQARRARQGGPIRPRQDMANGQHLLGRTSMDKSSENQLQVGRNEGEARRKEDSRAINVQK